MKTLSVVALLLQLVLISRLWPMRPAWRVFLAFHLASITQAALFQFTSGLRLWAFTETATLVLLVLAGRELFVTSARRIASMEWLSWALPLAGGLAGWGVAALAGGWPIDAASLIKATADSEAVVLLILAGAIGLSLALLRLFPLQADRGVGIHARILLVYIIGKALARLAGRFWPTTLHDTNIAMMGLWVTCLVGWVAFLVPPSPVRFSPETAAAAEAEAARFTDALGKARQRISEQE